MTRETVLPPEPVEPVAELDLRAAGRRPGGIGALYDRIAFETRAPYARWIGELGAAVDDRLDWWLESAATRNPVFSGLYHQVVSLLLLRALIDAGHCPRAIRVDTAAMAALAHGELTDRTVRVTGPSAFKWLDGRARSLLSPLRSIWRLTREWRAARGAATRAPLPADAILVDTFAIPGYVERDRYYPGLLEQAGAARDRLRFVPQFFNMTPAQIRESAGQLGADRYLVKEAWLGWQDLAWCFGHLFRLHRALPARATFRGLELAGLVREDVHRRLGFRCAVRGLMNYRFARALHEAGARPSLVVDWFENHPMDRGWNAGFNRWFDSVPRAGYTGFYPAGMSYRPTEGERRAGILPPRFLLIGEGFCADMGEFLADCPWSPAPAFRYPEWSAARETCKNDADGTDRILVAMPYYEAMCVAVLESVARIQALRPDWYFVIKAHPATPLARFPEATTVLAGNAEESGDALSAWLPRCAAMITGAQASTILESAALGVPAVIIHVPGSTAEVSIPSVMPPALVQVCTDGDGATTALDAMLDPSQPASARMAMARDFRERCFTAVNPDTVAAMLAA